MFEWLSELFSTRGFMPHGHCYLWTPGLLWLQVITNFVIALSYIAISCTLAYLIYKVRDIPFKAMYVAFGIFIVSCGVTHLFDVWVIWYPDYWIDGTVRFVTALASLGTAILLPSLVPQAVSLARGAKAAHDRGIRLESMVKDLEDLYERATRVDELKTRFYANVSHELRTPLALLFAPLERLDGMDLPEAARRELEVARRNADMLLRNVNDLLEVARLEAGEATLRWSSVELATMLRDIARNFESVARARRITWTVDLPERMSAQLDPSRIERVVVNVVANAFKYTPEGGTIRLALVDAGASAEIQVADSGPGIPVEHRDEVLERFRQLTDEKTGRFGGTGLGLAIVKDFVSMHGGTVTIEDAPEGGALFRIVLPRKAPADAIVDERPAALPVADANLAGAVAETLPPQVVEAPAPAADAPLVLVVEDNDEMRAYTSSILQPEYRVLSARDGLEGLELAERHRPDIIVTDVMMPRLGGDSLVRELHARPELADTPVVLLSARADDELRVELLRTGALDWIGKPFRPAELHARLGNLVRLKRARDVLQAEVETGRADIEGLARDLARRSRELAESFDQMRIAREYAERASQLKTSFLRVVSHELRSPLNVMGLQIELLRRTPAMPAKAIELLDKLRSSFLRMTELVDALLQKARFESGGVQLMIEEVDLAAVAREVVDEYEERAATKGIALTLHAPELPPIRTDRQLARIVVLNLVGNALKFTNEGGVDVTLEHVAGRHRITVGDTGRGIAEGDQARVFEPFEQLEPAHQKHTAGIGLGLSLVRDLVHALGGEVSLRSEVGVGSAFTVELRDVEEPE